MKKKLDVLLVDKTTGEYFEAKEKKAKRTEEFFIVTRSGAIDLAKKGLTGMEHNILLYLQGISDYDNFVPAITQSFIAAELSTSEVTVSHGLKKLLQLGLIHKIQRRGTFQYQIDPQVSTRGKIKAKG